MGFAGVIDSDAHVEEWAGTFDDKYLDEEFRRRRPNIVGTDRRAYWIIEDQAFPKMEGRGCYIIGTPTGYGTVKTPHTEQKPEELESMELRDADARVRGMKAEDIDLQVIYPTLFLGPAPSSDPRFAAALSRSYNSWMSDACAPQRDSLKWVAVVSLADVQLAVQEVRRVKTQLDAVGVMIMGTVGDRQLDDPTLLPFFAVLDEVCLPLGVHVGWSSPSLTNMYDTMFNSVNLPFTIPLLMGLVTMVGGGLFDRFPNLKVAFLEAGCQWVPFVIDRMNHYYDFLRARAPHALPAAKHRPIDYLRSGQIYVSTEVDDGLLPYVAEMIGEDHLLYSSDIPHGDREMFSVRTLRSRKDLSDSAKRKILTENPASFYGL